MYDTCTIMSISPNLALSLEVELFLPKHDFNPYLGHFILANSVPTGIGTGERNPLSA